jgi:hypothetical protein
VSNSEGGNISCTRNCLIERNVITESGNGAGISITGGTVLSNVIAGNKFHGLISHLTPTGYGNNVLVGNNSGGAQVFGLGPLHPNVCDPACP